VTERYERLEKIRHLAQQRDLLLQEEARPVAIALFNHAPLIIHLGFDQEHGVSTDWYHHADHPALGAIAHILDELAAWPKLEKLEFLISGGSDPMSNLQVQISRQIFRLPPADNGDHIPPSALCNTLATQRIYTFSRHVQSD
jgi:3,4-dihydroxy 2-butanone 4-phosphate synthase/GTP cyclohydrolase II